MKQVQTNDRESRIASVLSSYEGPTNHSVPVLDTFVDSSDESISYVVMSFLRILDEPPFHAVGEIVDFADQILEGLVFMHSKGVAHRDCSTPNIMMDATNMYPLGFHPVRDRFLDDVSTRAPVIPRSYVEVKYYFVDYGISSYFPPGSQRELVLGTAGRDQDVPELSDEVPYDPFKVDIFTIGNVFHQLFHEKYSNYEFFCASHRIDDAEQPCRSAFSGASPTTLAIYQASCNASASMVETERTRRPISCYHYF